jgi:hypothetical protein
MDDGATRDDSKLPLPQRAALSRFLQGVDALKERARLTQLRTLLAEMERANDPHLPEARQLLQDLEVQVRLLGIVPDSTVVDFPGIKKSQP